MSLPEKKIKTVQLPDSNTYEIIPERLQKNSYEATLPSLTQDSVLALSSDIKYIPHFPSAISGTAAVESSPYTSALWDATCDEVTSLYDGMMMIIRVPVAGNATYGVALKINNGTYHPVVYNISRTVGTRYGVNSTIVVVYNATQTAQMFYNSTSIVTVTGVWQVYDYDSDTDTTYRLRNSSAIYVNKSSQSTNRRTLLFEVDGGLSATNKTITTGTTKVPLNFKYIPGGQIRYYSVSGAIAADANFDASGLWEQYAIDIRYSFNTGSTLVEGNPVYIRMIVNSDGTLSQDASSSGDNPIVQALPSTADNKVYVYLGRAGGTTTLELEPTHPIYEYKNGAIRLWTNAVSSGGTSTDVQINGTSITSNNVANIVTNSAYNSSSNKIATMSDISRAIIPAFTDNYTSFSSDIRDYIISSTTMRPSIIFMVRIQPYPGDFLVTCIPNENKFIITNDNERYVATVSSISGSDFVWASLMDSANKVDYATSTQLATKQNALTTSSVNDGTLNKAIGFDASGNLVKGTAGSSIPTITIDSSQVISSYPLLQFTLTSAQQALWGSQSPVINFEFLSPYASYSGVGTYQNGIYSYIRNTGTETISLSKINSVVTASIITIPSGHIPEHSANEVLFYSKAPFSITVSNPQWDGNLYLDYDEENAWDGTSYFAKNTAWGYYYISLYGVGNTVINSNLSVSSPTSTLMYCIGNINVLLDKSYANRTDLVLPANCFRQLFAGCSDVDFDVTLPAISVGNYCYQQMFAGCYNMTKAPELPATTLGEYCYSAMFVEGTYLTKIPEVLPATTLASHCYEGMFDSCSSIQYTPRLPATTLADGCYYSMFSSCYSLLTLPELPATALTQACYRAMFNGCENIKLSATKTGEYQTSYRIPSVDDGTDATNALRDMFAATGGTFDEGTPTINTTYYTSNRIIEAEPTPSGSSTTFVDWS